MTRTRDKIALFGLLLLGAWGCGRTPATADVQKKQLEARTAKLEADLADATARLNESEQLIAREQARGRTLERDRDELYSKLKQAAGQRDATQAQFETLVRKLEGVLGETKAAISRPAGEETTVTATASGTSQNPSN